MQDGKAGDYTFRADTGLRRGKTQELLENKNSRRLIDMLGVKYVVGRVEEVEILEKYNFRKVFPPSNEETQDKYAVFENRTVLPRAFLASHWEGPPAYYEDNLTEPEIDKIRRKLIFQKLISDNFDYRDALVLEKPSPISPQAGEGTVEIVSYKPNEVIIKTKADQPKLLFLSDNWYPGWKAKVDEEEVEILRANYTFRAVPLGPGEHMVKFYFDSFVFKIGFLISVFSLGIMLFVLFRKVKYL
jgi:uncharacterized membrane protein YfhO